METTRQSILDHASRLAILHGEVPSLNALAEAAGLSKGGLMHHFPSRDALLTALAADGISAVDDALERASRTGNVVSTWLRLSIPDEKDIALFHSMASVFFAGRSEQDAIQRLAAEANLRWEELLEKELGNADAARAARLLGDGLLFSAISGTVTSENSATYLKAAEAAIDALIEANR